LRLSRRAAFAKLITALKTTPEKLLADKALLTKVLSYHVVPGEQPSSLGTEQKMYALLPGQSTRALVQVTLQWDDG
jgi:uncharacterized surface protein with fasciclin (FAS1) repeats